MTALILTSPKAMTNRLPGTPRLGILGEKLPLTSDRFTGNDGVLAGRITDAGLGGEPMEWRTTNAEALAVKSGRVEHTAAAGSYFTFIESPGPNARCMEVAVTVVSRPTGSVYLDLFRTAAGITPNVKYRITLAPNGTGLLTTAVTSEPVPGSEFTYAAGDRIAATVNTATNRVRVDVNGSPRFDIAHRPAQPITGNLFGFAGAAGSNAVLDDFALSEMTL